MAISRRQIFAAGGLGTLGIAGVAAYRQAPMFWDQYRKEMFRPVAEAAHKPTPKDWPDRGLFSAWLGHATTLIKIDGFTILTDPVFSDRCGIDVLVGTLGPKRLAKPALSIAELPKIDLVLLSHAHFDHWDLPSLRAIASQKIPVVCARQTSDLLTVENWQSVRELGWREAAQIGPVQVKAMEVRHWGARVRRDTYRGYNGYVLESGRYKVLFGGDSAFTPLFKEVKTAKPFDLGILPIGAYNPWIANHCTPEQAVQMANWAGVERIMPIHHQTFVLSSEPILEPIARFFDSIGQNTDRAVAHEIGREWSVIT